MAWTYQKTEELSDRDFSRWAQLLEERTGIALVPQHKHYLQTQISMRMREIKIDSYADYFRRVNAGVAGRAEWSLLVDRLMVKETSFFRHDPSFECVGVYLQEKINNQQLNDSFDVWSVGCSTGEEPYSLAILLSNIFQLANLKPYFGVFATDVSLPALSKAREGIYSARKLERISDADRARYFKKRSDGKYEVEQSLKDRICLNVGSVLEESTMPVEKMDVIFCQNLLIYFRKEKRKKILDSLIEHLKPQGMLVIGLGETIDWQHPQLSPMANQQVQAYIKAS